MSIKNLGLALASLAVMFLCAEIALRLHDLSQRQPTGGPRLPTGKIHDYFYYDANGCFRIVPHAVGLHRPYEGQTPVTVRINGHGFRGPDPNTNARTRVVFVGDSIVFAGGVPDETTFVRVSEGILNRSLSDSQRPVECLNLGTTDAGTVQYAAKVRDHALHLKPDVIVLGFYLNDSRPPQGFLGEDGYGNGERRLVNGLLYRSAAVRGLHTVYRSVKFSRNKRLSVRFRWVDRFRSGVWTDDPEACKRLIEEADYDWGAAWVTSSWSAVERDLTVMADLCRKQDVRFVLVCFPASPQVHFTGSFPRLFYPQEKLASICAEMSIPFLDLLPVLRGHRDEHLFSDQCHLTATGNHVAAEALAPWLTTFVRDREQSPNHSAASKISALVAPNPQTER